MPATRNDLLWEIERINKFHIREQFNCGEESLNTFLQKHARQNDEKNIGRTFVAVIPGKRKVEGYYTSSNYSIDFYNLPEKERSKLPRYPIPMVKLGRLAVDLKTQRKGLGETLLLHALRNAYDVNKRIAVYGLIVDAKNEKAKKFYNKYGFLELSDHSLNLFITIQKIEQLFI